MEYLAIFAIGVYCLWAVDGKHICLAMVFADNQSVYHLIFTLTKQEMTHEDNYRFLASSNELNNDRNSFQALIAKLDDIYEPRGIRIKCRRCL